MSKYDADIARRYSLYNKEKEELKEILKLYLQAIRKRKKAQELALIHESKPTPIFFEKSITDYVRYLQQNQHKRHRHRDIALSKDELKSLIDRCVDYIIRSYEG